MTRDSPHTHLDSILQRLDPYSHLHTLHPTDRRSVSDALAKIAGHEGQFMVVVLGQEAANAVKAKLSEDRFTEFLIQDLAVGG